MWSNPDDVVLSPFMGIGSEGVVALKLKRRFFGVELKESYWRQACRYLDVEDRQGGLFDSSDYDGQKDLAGSIDEGFRTIRERVAAGGPGWTPKTEAAE